MRSMITCVALLLALTASVARAAESVIHLKDGGTVTGEIVDEDEVEVQLKVKFGTVSYRRSEIEFIEKADTTGGAGSESAADLRDVVVLTSGDTVSGLLVSEDADEVVFDVVMSGSAVSKTLLARTTYRRGEVREIRKLTDARRAEARRYLAGVKLEAARDAVAEKSLAVERVRLTSKEAEPFNIVFKDEKKKPVLKKIELEHFVIVADLDDELLRKLACRLGKVFNKYKEIFGVERNEAKKVHVVVLRSLTHFSKATGLPPVHPAFYSPDRKLIWAGFAMDEYRAAIAVIRKHHAELVKRLNDYEAKIDAAKAKVRGMIDEYKRQLKRWGGTSAQAEAARRAIMRQIRSAEIRWQLHIKQYRDAIEKIKTDIRHYNRKNDVLFDEHTKAMIHTMYHEGFHAFLDQFLFDEEFVKHVPRWLNEGLAQYFELARLEGARLLLGREDRDRLAFLRKHMRGGTLVSIDGMMNAGAEEFMAHNLSKSEVETSRKHYYQSWCLVHILGKRRAIKKERMRAFVRALAEEKPAMEALPLLTGMPNSELRVEWEKLLGSSIRVE